MDDKWSIENGNRSLLDFRSRDTVLGNILKKAMNILISLLWTIRGYLLVKCNHQRDKHQQPVIDTQKSQTKWYIHVDQVVKKLSVLHLHRYKDFCDRQAINIERYIFAINISVSITPQEINCYMKSKDVVSHSSRSRWLRPPSATKIGQDESSSRKSQTWFKYLSSPPLLPATFP